MNFTISYLFIIRVISFCSVPACFSFFVCNRKPAVIMVVGVNGGGKTTSLGEFLTSAYHGYSIRIYLVIANYGSL